MTDIIDTLHPESNPNDNIYPNIKAVNIPSGAVATSKIANFAVESTKLASEAVETSKIKDGAVTTAKLANGAVNGNKLATTINDIHIFTDTTYMYDIRGERDEELHISDDQHYSDIAIYSRDEGISISTEAEDDGGSSSISLSGNVIRMRSNGKNVVSIANDDTDDSNHVTGRNTQLEGFNVNDPVNDTDIANKRYLDNREVDLLFDLAGKTPSIVNDNTTAYQKVVPTGATRAKIKSIGGMSYKCYNLFNKDSYNYSNKYYNGVGVLTSATDNSMHDEAITVLPNTQYTFSVNTAQAFLGVAFFNDGTFISKTQTTNKTSLTFTTPNNCNKVYFNTNYNSQAISANYLSTIEPMLNTGSTALPYQPYFTGIRDSVITSVKSYDSNNNLIDTYTIPNEIQALEGYGRGINSNVYNVLDFDIKVFTDKDSVVDLGTLNYTKLVQDVVKIRFVAYFENQLPNIKASTFNDLLGTNKFGNQLSPEQAFEQNKNWYIGATSIGFYTQDYDNAETFKTAMNGVPLQYERNTYNTTNVSQHITDNIIQVEAGGYLVFENEFGQAVPSNITYLTGLDNLDDLYLKQVKTITGVMQAYIKQTDGTQIMTNVHWDNIRDTIPIRDQTGNIRVATTPTTNTHATSKQYVDGRVTGTNDGTNWTALTIGGVTKNIPTGGSGGSTTLEDIKDSSGNYRFIDGDCTIVDTTSGNTYLYSKWSLSGTHLMIVVCASYTNGGYGNYARIANVFLPQWLLDKITPIWYNTVTLLTDVVDQKSCMARSASGQGQNSRTIRLIKDTTNNCLYLENFDAGTLNDRVMRMQFDLLIDNTPANA